MVIVTLRNSILDYIISQSANLFNPEPYPAHSVSCIGLIPSLQAARDNLILSRSLAPLSPYTFHSFHYTFSAAIAIVVQSFLPNETLSSDAMLVAEAFATLAGLGKTNESSESCARMVRDLSVVVENVKEYRDGTGSQLAELQTLGATGSSSNGDVHFLGIKLDN
jgi:hypothetical protein